MTASSSFYGVVLGWTRGDDNVTAAYAHFASDGHDISGLRPKVTRFPMPGEPF